MGHLRFAEQQPGNCASDHRELASKIAEELADFNQYGLDCCGGAVVVVGAVLRL